MSAFGGWQLNAKFLEGYNLRKRKDAATILAFEALGEERYHKVASAMCECAPTLQIIAERGANPKGLSLKTILGFRCKKRLCQICNQVRSSVVFAKAAPRFEQALAEHPGARLLLITLTAGQTVPLDQIRVTCRRISKAVRKMRQTKDWKNAFIGDMRAIEVTINHEAGRAHCHTHIAVIARPGYFSKRNDYYLPQERLLVQWRRKMADPSIEIVDTRAVRPKKPGMPLTSALTEVCKYPLSPAPKKGLWHSDGQGGFVVDPQTLKAVHDGLRGLRLYAFGGVLRAAAREIEAIDRVDGEWAITDEHLARLMAGDFDPEPFAGFDFIWNDEEYVAWHPFRVMGVNDAA